MRSPRIEFSSIAITLALAAATLTPGAAGRAEAFDPQPEPPGKQGLRRGEKSILVGAGATRTTDGQGNATIVLPDGRRIRISKGGQIQIVSPTGQVIGRGKFVRWAASPGMRLGKREQAVGSSDPKGQERAGRSAARTSPAGVRAGARSAGGRAGAAQQAGQLLIYQ